MNLRMNLSSAVRHVNKRGILLVFPIENKKDPTSLWAEFFPRSKMKWEWDSGGDNRVAQLWLLREKLSRSRKVVYSKWFRGRATLMSFELFTALLRLANPELPAVEGLSREAQEILDLLEEDSPLSTKQLKRLSGLQGREAERFYNKALQELWTRQLIVAFGEVDEGAFPSLAIGATKVIFEDLWNAAQEMSHDQADEILNGVFVPGTAFDKYYRTLKRRWNERYQQVLQQRNEHDYDDQPIEEIEE